MIRKQGQLKTSLDEAASSLRSLLDRFISRLAMMTDSTDDFQNKIRITATASSNRRMWKNWAASSAC